MLMAPHRACSHQPGLSRDTVIAETLVRPFIRSPTSTRSVTVVGRNINCRNKNGLWEAQDRSHHSTLSDKRGSRPIKTRDGAAYAAVP
jgi:hypothetical protein